MRAFIAQILLIFLIIHQGQAQDSALVNVCVEPSTHHYIDISQAVIERTKKMQYSLQLFDTPITVNRTNNELILNGKFSRLIIRKNGAQKQEHTYYGKELHIKVPPNHVFNLEKIPQLQIQIIHQNKQQSNENPINFVILSQLYVVSKFTNKIETLLSSHLNSRIKDGDVIPTSKLIKIIEGFPMLMYQGSQETYPCRKDLLCFIKRQYQLISQKDFQQIKAYLNFQSNSILRKKAFRRKKLVEVPAIKNQPSTKAEIDEQL